MARSNVPKFGNWQNENSDGGVPYTVYFDNARKKKTGGLMINPNDPQQNPDMFPKPKARPEEPIGRVAPVRPMTPEHRDGDYRQSQQNPDMFHKPKARPEEPIGRVAPERPTAPDHRDGDYRQFSNSSGRGNNEPGYGGRGGQRPARAARPEQGFERSPLHPQLQGKATEGRNHDSSHGTPVRQRVRPVPRADESPERGAAVPKFGAWNENDPQAAENFTHIFNRVRDERNTGAGNPMATPKRTPNYSTGRAQPSDEPKRCCFPW